MRHTIHDAQLVLVGADATLLAELDLRRAERLTQTRQLREQRRLAGIGRAQLCCCARPLIFDRGHCLACGHDTPHTEEAA